MAATTSPGSRPFMTSGAHCPIVVGGSALNSMPEKQRIAGEGLEAATQIGDVVIAEHHVHVAGGVHECLRVEHPPQPRDETTIDGSSEIALR